MGSLVLLGLGSFCIYGFLAPFEYADIASRLPWQIGYGTVGFMCGVGAARLLPVRRRHWTPGGRDVPQ